MEGPASCLPLGKAGLLHGPLGRPLGSASDQAPGSPDSIQGLPCLQPTHVPATELRGAERFVQGDTAARMDEGRGPDGLPPRAEFSLL